MPADERKQSILLASIPLFAKKGFEGTTTTQIADVSGVSEALLYRHFKSKEEIYSGIQTTICDRKEKVFNEIPKLPLHINSLNFILYFILNVITRNPRDDVISKSIPRLVLMSLLESGEFVRILNETRLKPLIPVIAEQLEHAKEVGVISSKVNLSAEEVLWYGHNLAVGLSMMQLPEKEVFEFQLNSEDKLKHIFEYILRAIGYKDSHIKSVDWEMLESRFVALMNK